MPGPCCRAHIYGVVQGVIGKHVKRPTHEIEYPLRSRDVNMLRWRTRPHPEGGVDSRTLTEFDAWFVSETAMCGVSWGFVGRKVFDACCHAEPTRPTARGGDATGSASNIGRRSSNSKAIAPLVPGDVVLTNQKHGVSALGLQRILGLGSYQTAWALVAARHGEARISWAAREVDATYVGGRETGVVARSDGKSIVAIAAEVRGRGRIRIPEDVDKPFPFVWRPGAVRTDAGEPVVWRKAQRRFPPRISAVATRPSVRHATSCIGRGRCRIRGRCIYHGAIDAGLLSRRSLSTIAAVQARGLLFFRLSKHEPAYKGQAHQPTSSRASGYPVPCGRFL